MRKRIKTKKLSRSANQRKALFRSLITALAEHEEIKTTKTKAKAVRSLIEKLITKGKKGTLHSRRLIQRVVVKRQIANKIVDDLAQRYLNRPGGYTKMVVLGNRRGDNAPIVKFSFVQPKEKPFSSPKTKKTTKTSKTSKKPTQSSQKTSQSASKSTKSTNKQKTTQQEV